MADTAQDNRTGVILATTAYAIWGVLPLYIHLLQSVPALQVLAHRILWSLLLLAIVVVVLRRAGGIARAARGRTLALLMLSALLIATNWIVYIWAVQNGHVLEASLGYFINPLVNVALGILVLGERLHRIQGIAIGVAGLGVALLAISGGGALWVSLTLAVSFGFYGLVRKVAPIDALGGLTIETLLLAPLSAAWLAHVGWQGDASFGHTMRLDLLLIFAGVITALPLLLFAAAAKRLPLAEMGLLQYLAPSLQFLQAVLFFHERVTWVHIVTFALIWGGCAIYAFDSLRTARQQRALRAAT